MELQNSTHNIYKELVNKIYFPFLFFLPAEFKNLFKGEKEFKIVEAITNVLIVLDDQHNNYLVEENDNLFFLLKKSSVLESNFFTLIDAKESLSRNQFIVLLDKYKLQIDFWTYISKELEAKSKDREDLLFQKYKSYFFIQLNAFTTHQIAIENQFNNPKRTEHSFDSVKHFFRIQKGFDEQNIDLKKVVKISESSKKKLPIITNEEADTYLLKSVFGINLEVMNKEK
ncbi:hypothetical protein [Polaribacter aestuariivivens]|uniref:hypothetical protein n=1 Tax=Polaribacter aestuariivivens TaxID=2304626 RepID=UPI003F496DA0